MKYGNELKNWKNKCQKPEFSKALNNKQGSYN